MYEASFILDNREVKKGWKQVKAQLIEVLGKHGCKPIAARRWEDRKLAYEIKKQKRATYLLSYLEIEGEQAISELNKELLLTGYVLRHMFLKVDKVPEEEIELSRKEDEELERAVESEDKSDDHVVIVREGSGKRTAQPSPETAGEPAAKSSEAEPERKAEAEPERQAEPKAEPEAEPEAEPKAEPEPTSPTESAS